MWTKEDTDQLFDLCERFDLRFVVIADRFPSSRTVEELKDRYYSGIFTFFHCLMNPCLDLLINILSSPPIHQSTTMHRHSRI